MVHCFSVYEKTYPQLVYLSTNLTPTSWYLYRNNYFFVTSLATMLTHFLQQYSNSLQISPILVRSTCPSASIASVANEVAVASIFRIILSRNKWSLNWWRVLVVYVWRKGIQAYMRNDGLDWYYQACCSQPNPPCRFKNFQSLLYRSLVSTFLVIDSFLL